jgi:predicted adenine nucleotide alpha hydrolase (AANH) superfamily ATPase
VINEYSAQMTDEERAKVITSVIKSSPKKNPELSLQSGEGAGIMKPVSL